MSLPLLLNVVYMSTNIISLQYIVEGVDAFMMFFCSSSSLVFWFLNGGKSSCMCSLCVFLPCGYEYLGSTWSAAEGRGEDEEIYIAEIQKGHDSPTLPAVQIAIWCVFKVFNKCH